MLGRSPALVPLVILISCILLADIFQFPAFIWWLISALAIIAAILSNRSTTTSRYTITLISLSLSVGAGGAAYYQSARLDQAANGIPSAFIDTGDVSVFGAVRDWPRISRAKTELVVDLDSIRTDQAYPVHGAIQIVLEDTTTFVQLGDVVMATGRLLPTPVASGRFSYQQYLARQGIGAQLYLSNIIEIMRVPGSPGLLLRVAQSLRTALIRTLQKVLPPDESSLAAGFLVGETRDLPMQTMLLFRETGTLHLLAVSGANVWLIVGFLMVVLRPIPLGRVSRTVIILVSILIFLFMCYAEASVTRASVLVMLVLIGRLTGRKIDLLHLLAVAALSMLVCAPWQLFSVGFQLSFLTATALVASLTPLQEYLEKKRTSRWQQGLILAVAGSIVASVLSAPLIWWNFERISVVSIPANILVAPLVSIATVGALTAAVVYAFLPMLGVWIGALVHLPLAAVMNVVSWFGLYTDDIQLPIRDDLLVGIWIFSFYLVLALILTIPKSKQRFAVFFVLLSATAAFSGGLINRFTQPKHQIFVEPIPGGSLVAITRDGGLSADLLISGMRSRRYPVDSVVIAPLLERLGFQTINSLAAYGVEFNAMDDLLRVCTRTNAGALLLSAADEHSYVDWIKIDSILAPKAVRFCRSTGSDSAGVSMSRAAYHWQDSMGEFLASASDSLITDNSMHGGWKIRFYGGQKISDSIRQGADLLICANLEQPHAGTLPGSTEDGVLNLQREGALRIFLSDQLEIQTGSGKTIYRKRLNAR